LHDGAVGTARIQEVAKWCAVCAQYSGITLQGINNPRSHKVENIQILQFTIKKYSMPKIFEFVDIQERMYTSMTAYSMQSTTDKSWAFC